LGASWAVVQHQLSPFPWLLFVLTMLGAMALHVAANTFNDYFDWTSGTDKVNNDYFLPYSGGSRSMELGLISDKGMLRVALGSLGIATALGLAVMVLSRQPLLILFGVMGALSGYFYTAPPLRLVARKGIGELLIGLNFGPLTTAGTVLALTGTLAWTDFLVGVPVGLLTTAILWINQFPDEAADRISGKHNLVVVLGGKRARWGYLALVAGAFVIGVAGVLAAVFPPGMLAILAALPLAISAIRITFQHYQHRELVTANARTVYLQMAAGLLAAGGPLLTRLIAR
jgi:1,4-dihydroxy-2-naphthoate octaprenyltransferase